MICSRPPRLSRALTLAPAVTLAVLALALGPATGSALADTGHSHPLEFGAPAAAATATRTVEVTIGDASFQPAALSVKSGETVRFVLHNTSAALHEFNLGTNAMHAQHRQEMTQLVERGLLNDNNAAPAGSMMMAMDHGAGSSAGQGTGQGAMAMHHQHTNSVLVPPGTTQELTWHFSHPGTIEFACDIPGHYEAGMVGQLSITP